MPNTAIPYSDIGGGVAPGSKPFGRKAWDNPVKYKLDRAYGDEYEYTSFADMTKRIAVRNVTEAKTSFPGGSSIEVNFSQGDALLYPVPAGDGEWLLEANVGIANTLNGGMFGLALLNASGNGTGFSAYNDGNAYTWAVTSWIYAGTGNAVAHGLTFDNRHYWTSMKKSGTNITGRISANGTSFTSFTAASTLSVTPVYLAVIRLFSGGGGFTHLHRLNFYPASGYFPG